MVARGLASRQRLKQWERGKHPTNISCRQRIGFSSEIETMISDLERQVSRRRQRIGFSSEIETWNSLWANNLLRCRQRIGFSSEIETFGAAGIEAVIRKSPEDWLLVRD